MKKFFFILLIVAAIVLPGCGENMVGVPQENGNVRLESNFKSILDSTIFEMQIDGNCQVSFDGFSNVNPSWIIFKNGEEVLKELNYEDFLGSQSFQFESVKKLSVHAGYDSFNGEMKLIELKNFLIQ